MNAMRVLALMWALMDYSSFILAADVAYPTKPIRLISPYAAGGGNSVVARLVGQQFTDAWGQQVVIDSRPGGNTVVGTEVAARAPADGYTLFMLSSSHVIVPHLIKVTFDPIKDFLPLGMIARYSFVLLANNALPADNIRQLIALAKSKPGQLNYASFGGGSSSHLGMELFARGTGTQMQHVPYKGASPALTDLIGSQVQLFLSTPPPAIPLVKAGRVKAIAVSGAARLPALPQTPTIAESGLPGYQVMGWWGLSTPTGTPRGIVTKLASELAKMSSISDMREKIVAQGAEPHAASVDEVAALMRADSAKWGKVIRESNIRLEN